MKTCKKCSSLLSAKNSFNKGSLVVRKSYYLVESSNCFRLRARLEYILRAIIKIAYSFFNTFPMQLRYDSTVFGLVAELAYASGLGPDGATLESSNLSEPTNYRNNCLVKVLETNNQLIHTCNDYTRAGYLGFRTERCEGLSPFRPTSSYCNKKKY